MIYVSRLALTLCCRFGSKLSIKAGDRIFDANILQPGIEQNILNSEPRTHLSIQATCKFLGTGDCKCFINPFRFRLIVCSTAMVCH